MKIAIISGESHGRPEYGLSSGEYGHWIFKICNEEKTFTGEYSDVKKQAVEWARRRHPHRFISIMLAQGL